MLMRIWRATPLLSIFHARRLHGENEPIVHRLAGEIVGGP